MAVYNISTETEYNIPKATWDTGNDREDILIRPRFGVADYVSCMYEISLSGNITLTRNCRLPTEAWHGAQPNEDTMINNIIVEKI